MLYYITGNEGKIRVANKYLKSLGIEVTQKSLELIEIQSHSIEEITSHKAEQAFAELNKPLLVNDAGWNIPALNGFPGAYMRYVNEWFTPDDFLNLMREKDDRSIIYTEYFCYKDHKITKLFTNVANGYILTEPKGSNKLSTWCLVSFRDDKKTIAQSWDEGLDPIEDYTVWKEFATWYKKYSSDS